MANRKLRVVLTTLAVTSGGVATAAIVGACSASTGPSPGAVMVAIDTNMKVPDDIDEIGISASLANVDGGTVWENTAFELKPKTNDVFPATFAVVRGTDQPVAIRVVGYKDGVPLTLRDAVVTLPPDRTAVLRMPIDWLDKGSAVAPTTTKDLSTAASSSTLPLDCSSICPSGQTSVAGTCQAYGLQTNLPDYDPRAFPSSENSSACLDVDACFPNFNDGSLDVKLDKSTCSFVPTLPPAQMNVAIRLGPVGNGWGNGYGHVMPLAQDPTDGWSLGTNGAVILPPSVCTNAKILGVIATASSDKCPFKGIDVPACQIYPDASSTNPPAIDAGGAMDATMEMTTDAAEDAGDVVDAAPAFDSATPIDSTTYALTGTGFEPLAIAVDTKRVYVLATNGNAMSIVTVDPMFESGALPSGVPAPVGVSSPAVMAAYDGHVFVDESTLKDYWLFDVFDGGASDAGINGFPNAVTALAAYRSNTDAGTAFVFGSPTSADFQYRYSNGTGSEDRVHITALSIDSTTLTSGNPFFASGVPADVGDLDAGRIYYSQLTLPTITAGVLAADIVAMPTAYAVQTAVADPSHVAWNDKDGRVCFSGTTTSDAGGTCFASNATTTPGTFVGGQSAVFWIGSDNSIYKASFAGGAPSVDAGGTSTGLGPAKLLFLSGNQLYWTDSTSVHRRDVRSIP